jgi:hypothetical protein
MTALGVGAVLAGAGSAGAQEFHPGFRLVAGYKNIDLDYEFLHDTHPDDFNLPNAGVPNSAGPTDLGRLDLGALGIGYEVALGRSFSANFDLGGLAGGDRAEARAINDLQPDSKNRLYSEARYGFFATAGVVYHVRRVYFGVEGQLAGLWVENGWVRSGKDQAQESGFELVPTGGPKVGFQIDQDWSIEASAQFGRSMSFGVQVRWRL